MVNFFLRLIVKFWQFLRLTAKFLAVLWLTVNPIVTLFVSLMTGPKRTVVWYHRHVRPRKTTNLVERTMET